MDILIVGVLLVLILGGVVYTFKHFKGESACCGGGTKVETVEKKVLDKVIGQKVLVIEGMHCDHCKGWVEKAINAIDGCSCEVDLVKNEAVVSFAKEVSDKDLYKAVDKAGYRIKEIH